MFVFLSLCPSTTHRELFVKLLEAEEEDLLEGKREMAGDFCEAEGRRVAAEEEVETELLAGGEAGDERATVARESGGDDVVRGFGVSGERFERGSDGGYCTHRRRQCDCGEEVKHELSRLARLVGREEVANPGTAMRCTRRDFIAARDEFGHGLLDANKRFLLCQFGIPFRARPLRGV